LSNFVAYGFLNLQDGSYDLLERLSGEENHPEKFVSETVHDQIRVLAADGLEPAEKHVFSELDNLSRIVGGSNHARIIAGTCLLRLLVLYRDRLLRDQIRLELPGAKPCEFDRLSRDFDDTNMQEIINFVSRSRHSCIDDLPLHMARSVVSMTPL
jgi:hypothetical protein